MEGEYMQYVQLALMVSTGIYIIYKDLKERIIPNPMNLFLLICGVVIMLITGDYLSHLLGFFVFGISMFLIAVISKGFGMGDVKYVFVSGLVLGFKLAGYGLVIGIMLGGLFSAILLVMKKVKKDDYISYGPYLVLGNIIALIII